MNEKKFRAVLALKIFIALLEVGLFGLVLWNDYGPMVFEQDRWLGYLFTIVLYVIVYISLGKLFRAFKIADYSISETIFSQVLAFGLTDLLLFVEMCLVHGGYITLVPGIITALEQFAAAAIWALIAKRITIVMIRPERTLIIYGDQGVEEFLVKLEKLAHIFDVQKVVSWREIGADWRHLLDEYQAVILYEVSLERRSAIIHYCMQKQKSLYVTPQINDIIMQGFGARHLIDTPMLKYEYHSERFGYLLFKRLSDIVVSLLVLIITSPILAVVAIAIKAEDHGPVFYKQKRCTKNGKVFEIIKFRSMIVDAEKEGRSIPATKGDPRITRVGRIIRMIRVDELPQIINVLKGDMSLVGPRPERVEHVEEYTRQIPEFAYRMRVKGGLTGYAQIYGKYNTSPYDKLRLDLQYIEKQSTLLDFKLLLLTIKIMFVPESSEGFSEAQSEQISQEARKVDEILTEDTEKKQ